MAKKVQRDSQNKPKKQTAAKDTTDKTSKVKNNQNNSTNNKSKTVNTCPKKSNEKSMTLFICKTAGLTVLVIVAVFYFCIACLMSLAPIAAANVFEVVGSKNAITIAYEQEYKHNQTITNLYNLVQKSVESGDSQRVEHYANILVSLPDYAEFEEKINTASIKNVPLSQVAFCYDIDSYINSVYIKAVYENGDKQYAMMNFHQFDLQDIDHIYTVSLVPFINCLYNDKDMTLEEKREMLSSYWSMRLNDVSIEELYNIRLNQIGGTYEETLQGRIFNVYTQIKINESFTLAYEILGNSTKRLQHQERVNLLKIEYNNLISEQV